MNSFWAVAALAYIAVVTIASVFGMMLLNVFMHV